jgi:hypothetical protein
MSQEVVVWLYHPVVDARSRRTKETNFSVHEDNVFCKCCLEISCDLFFQDRALHVLY